MTCQTDVLIVGGGLAGLRLADLLTQAGRDYILIEARNRLGGRVLGHRFEGQTYDLGPAWYWPGQPRMAALVSRFKLNVFDQFASGAGIFETAQGHVQRAGAIASMQGALRLQSGMEVLCDALAAGLSKDRVVLNTPLICCMKTPQGLSATCGDRQIKANHLVLALPPRLAAAIEWAPALPPAAVQAMEKIPTWMAGQAKAVAVYDRPFWRDAGLSGDAASYRGPLGEIHDASSAQGGPAAVFGFVGLAPAQRLDQGALKEAILAQLLRLFGPKAAEPRDLVLKDWARDPFTASPADLAPLATHPTYGTAPALQNLWDGRLHFGGTEAAKGFGGYLEGALEAAEQSFHALCSTPEVKACH